jgi:cysteinyl-tRNA synthetase
MTTLKLYNTLIRSKEAFTPIDANNVRMYVCGPTVYDFAHIGNARPVIVFDVLFRLLRHLYGEDHVTYVRNITDVDDKINARALCDFPDLPLNDAIRKVTEKTANQFHEDVKALGCLVPTHEPRATDHIDGMVKIINDLIKRGHAYVASGNEGREVLFAVGSMKDYGKLSGRKLEDQQAGARIAVEAHKRNPGDFVLWKESVADQPGWSASFRENDADIAIFGRPGWHIECSAMSQFHLGTTFDIHGGGLDLIFPHHENEIAQSRCAHGTDVMANVWMHNGFLQVEGKKMSKSDGNFVTISELLHTDKFGGRNWDGAVLRIAMLSTHYRQPIDWTVDKLRATERRHSYWLSRADLFDLSSDEVTDAYGTTDFMRLIVAPLADDMNSHMALANLDLLADRATSNRLNAAELVAGMQLLGIRFNRHPSENGTPEPEFYLKLAELATSIGIDLFGEENFNTVMDKIIKKRLAFLAAKNFTEADRIRDELLAQGIQLKDGKDPVTSERVTMWEVKR